MHDVQHPSSLSYVNSFVSSTGLHTGQRSLITLMYHMHNGVMHVSYLFTLHMQVEIRFPIIGDADRSIAVK